MSKMVRVWIYVMYVT